MAIFLDGHGGCCACARDKCTYDCATYRIFKPKPITNSMRIRTMTDEELAEWIAGGVLNLTGGSLKMATEAWLDWLRKEARE